MHVFKTVDGLAISLPPDVVTALQLTEGDSVQISAFGPKSATIVKKLAPEEMVARLQSLPKLFPAGFVFNREEANER